MALGGGLTDQIVWLGLGHIGLTLRLRYNLRAFRQKLKAGVTWWCGESTQGIIDQHRSDLRQARRERLAFAKAQPEAAQAAMKRAKESGLPYDVS